MSKKKRFLLRLDPSIYDALQAWASDEWRSVNAQIEFLLRDALRRSGRLKEDRGSMPDAEEDREDDEAEG